MYLHTFSFFAFKRVFSARTWLSALFNDSSYEIAKIIIKHTRQIQPHIHSNDFANRQIILCTLRMKNIQICKTGCWSFLVALGSMIVACFIVKVERIGDTFHQMVGVLIVILLVQE